MSGFTSNTLLMRIQQMSLVKILYRFNKNNEKNG